MMNALSEETKPLVELGGALGKVAHALGAELKADTEVKIVTQGQFGLLVITWITFQLLN